MMSEADKQRLDKWLWVARFFKTRALAHAAIDGGKVHVNGERTKPSRLIKVDDCVTLNKDQLVYEFMVRALNDPRQPASEAQLMYEETAASMEKRRQQIEQNKLLRAVSPQPARRPDKKSRRQIIKFTRQDAG